MTQPRVVLLNLKYLTLLAKYSFLSQPTLTSCFSSSSYSEYDSSKFKSDGFSTEEEITFPTSTVSTTTTEEPKWKEPHGFNTGIQIYNPINKTKVPFIIDNPNYLKWYACGPTVYDSPHLGHAVCSIRLDIIRRILANYFFIHSVVISSVTDIDDKIINRAHSSNMDYKAVAKHYELEYNEAMDRFGVIPPTRATRVSEFIPHIKTFIEKLVKTDQAYIGKDGSVYFDVDKFPHYFKMWGEMDNDTVSTVKRSSLDFALWKSAKPGEPSFPSPWGPGRPGWHIECSAMASHFFGSRVDLHTGGIDLKFPHHENEEAQSCAYHNQSQWVNYWLHTGHLRGKDGTKMSKSLGNFITAAEFLKSHSPRVLRMMCLMSHYGVDMDYNEKKLSTANSLLEKFRTFVADCDNYMREKIVHGNVNTSETLSALENSKNKVIGALRDDFSTPKVIDTLTHLVSLTHSQLHSSNHEKTHPSTLLALAYVSTYVANTLKDFGLELSPTTAKSSDVPGPKVNAVLDSAVNFRTQVRKMAIELKKAKVDAGPVLNQCDAFRDELKALGIEIKDQKSEATWQFKEGVD